MEVCNLYDTTLKKREKRMKTIGCIFLILVLLTACSRVDITDPKNFKYFEGKLIHQYKGMLIVRADDGHKMNFKAGRRTVFTPNAWPNVGDRIRVRYLNKACSDYRIGDYFIAFEVSRVKNNP